jgi:hypothetical protein
MSGMRHATISAWQRQHEDGSFAAEINGWNLHVKWIPEGRSERRGFVWAAERSGVKRAGSDVQEEMEVAMALAEEAIEAEPVEAA